jgi:hypothetical protein
MKFGSADEILLDEASGMAKCPQDLPFLALEFGFLAEEKRIHMQDFGFPTQEKRFHPQDSLF